MANGEWEEERRKAWTEKRSVLASSSWMPPTAGPASSSEMGEGDAPLNFNIVQVKNGKTGNKTVGTHRAVQTAP